VHAVGVGSAVNRSLTQPVARAGRGEEAIVGLGEDPERAAQRLVQRSAAPLVVELSIGGSALEAAAPSRAPDLYAGAPALLALKLKPEGGELELRGRSAGGEWVERLMVPPTACGEGAQGVPALFAREAAEDLELELAAGGARRAIDEQLERLGLDFQIATRLTSWLAVAEQASVDPRTPSRREKIAQELPYGMSVEGLGLREAHPMPAMPAQVQGAPSGMLARTRSFPPASAASAGAPPPPPRAAPPKAEAAKPAPKKRKSAVLEQVRSFYSGAKDDEAPPAPSVADRLEEAEGREQGELPLDQGESKAERRAAPAPAPGGRTLRGKIVLRKSGELVLEILLDGELDWALPGEVTVIEDAGVWTAGVDEARTTRGGRLHAGQSLRLTLRLPEAAGRSTIRRVVMESTAGPITVEL
jgi:Ca-activated chloride channel family protein